MGARVFYHRPLTILTLTLAFLCRGLTLAGEFDCAFGPLELIESGGPGPEPLHPLAVPTAGEGNLARDPFAIAFGTQGTGFSTNLHHLSDGHYGHPWSWQISGVGSVTELSYAGIYFLRDPQTIEEIAIGRDNLDEVSTDVLGDFCIEWTTDEFNPASDSSVAKADWQALGSIPTSVKRQRYLLTDAITVRAIRFVGEVGNIIDEIELGTLEVERPDELYPLLELVEVGGPVFPVLADNVPTAEEGNIALGIDSLPISSGPIPNSENSKLNDGLYGADNAWVSNKRGTATLETYFGIYFSSGLHKIEGVALGRDNLGGESGNVLGEHFVQFTEESFNAFSDFGVASVTWQPLGRIPAASMRRFYEFDEPVVARAIRILTTGNPLGVGGNAIDELEVYGEDFEPIPPRPQFRRGDVDANGSVNVVDPRNNLVFQFLGSFRPPCLDAADTNDSGSVDVSDPLASLAFQFNGSPTIPAPGPMVCGPDLTLDVNQQGQDLGCTSFPPCNQ